MATQQHLPDRRSNNTKDLQHYVIPTILSYDVQKRCYVIGEEARSMGIQGRTNAYAFKELICRTDKQYEQPNRYWIAPTGRSDENTRTLSAKEVTQGFLSVLLKDIPKPEKLIFGIPATRDDAWLGNYKRHIKDIMTAIGRPPPDFFYEPFAVYQFYRNRYARSANSGDEEQTVLIIDVGGSTFNSLIIRTAKAGYLPRSGPASRPIGTNAEFCGGYEIDKLILDRVVAKAQKQGIVWKDDPRERTGARAGACILPTIEDAKIRLSRAMPPTAQLREAHLDYSVPLNFPVGTLHSSPAAAPISRSLRRSCGAASSNTYHPIQQPLSLATIPATRLQKGSLMK